MSNLIEPIEVGLTEQWSLAVGPIGSLSKYRIKVLFEADGGSQVTIQNKDNDKGIIEVQALVHYSIARHQVQYPITNGGRTARKYILHNTRGPARYFLADGKEEYYVEGEVCMPSRFVLLGDEKLLDMYRHMNFKVIGSYVGFATQEEADEFRAKSEGQRRSSTAEVNRRSRRRSAKTAT